MWNRLEVILKCPKLTYFKFRMQPKVLLFFLRVSMAVCPGSAAKDQTSSGRLFPSASKNWRVEWQQLNVIICNRLPNSFFFVFFDRQSKWLKMIKLTNVYKCITHSLKLTVRFQLDADMIWLLILADTYLQGMRRWCRWCIGVAMGKKITSPLPETNSSHLKIGRPPKGNWYSNHPFSGASC